MRPGIYRAAFESWVYTYNACNANGTGAVWEGEGGTPTSRKLGCPLHPPDLPWGQPDPARPVLTRHSARFGTCVRLQPRPHRVRLADVSIPPDGQEAVFLPARVQRLVRVRLLLVDLNFPRPVM